jgi:hypothetical protein
VGFAGAVAVSSLMLKSSQESIQKIVTVLIRNYALSGKNTLALFFPHKWKNEMWKVTQGVRTGGGESPANGDAWAYHDSGFAAAVLLTAFTSRGAAH